MNTFENDIRAAIRKKGEFTYNPYSPKQIARYAKILTRMKEDGELLVDCTIKDEWVYTKGPNWTRRPEKQK